MLRHTVCGQSREDWPERYKAARDQSNMSQSPGAHALPIKLRSKRETTFSANVM
jgi:hypothetical protein